jgi:hypothetical protein
VIFELQQHLMVDFPIRIVIFPLSYLSFLYFRVCDQFFNKPKNGKISRTINLFYVFSVLNGGRS